jgi:hypothetical protein
MYQYQGFELVRSARLPGFGLSSRRWACAGGGLKFLNQGGEGQGNGTIVHLDGVGCGVPFDGELVLEAIGATGLEDFGEIKETSAVDAILELACFIARHSSGVQAETAANSGEAAALTEVDPHTKILLRPE